MSIINIVTSLSDNLVNNAAGKCSAMYVYPHWSLLISVTPSVQAVTIGQLPVMSWSLPTERDYNTLLSSSYLCTITI